MATALFMLYSALIGLTLSIIFLVYTQASIASTFLVTAGTFGAMSVYGFVTKRDLTGLGSLLFMALIGLIIASLVNIFLRSPALYWIITYAGVLIFVGLTAYDTQRLKQVAVETAQRPRDGGPARGQRRADPVPRLHQPVPAAAADPGQPQVTTAAAPRFACGGRTRRAGGSGRLPFFVGSFRIGGSPGNARMSQTPSSPPPPLPPPLPVLPMDAAPAAPSPATAAARRHRLTRPRRRRRWWGGRASSRRSA